MKGNSIHSGHRQRLKERYMTSGFESFSDHEILELLLFYVIPRRDTNYIAHHLLDTFGSLSKVLDASAEDLKKAGVSESTAVFLRFYPNVIGRYLEDRNYNSKKQYPLDNISANIVSRMSNSKTEQLLLLLRDPVGMEVYCGIIQDSPIDENNDTIRNIIGIAMKYNASSAVIATNKINGVVFPTSKDVSSTIKLRTALAGVGMALIEHYILCEGEIFSMSGSEQFREIFI